MHYYCVTNFYYLLLLYAFHCILCYMVWMLYNLEVNIMKHEALKMSCNIQSSNYLKSVSNVSML